MERSIQKNGLVNLLVLLAVGAAGLAVARYASSLAGQVSSLFLGLGVLVAAVSWFQMRLEDRERIEKLELDELAKAHSGTAMFEARDAEVFPADSFARSRCLQPPRRFCFVSANGLDSASGRLPVPGLV